MAIKKVFKDNLILDEKVSSKEQTRRITTKVLSYFRFKRRCFYVATEVGVYHSDVLAYEHTKGILTEIEVKVSFSDFKNDFKKSYRRYGCDRNKHEMYASANSKSQWKPNFFYFAVPESLSEKVIKYLKDNNIKLGVIAVLDGCPQVYDRNPYVRIALRCPKLHSNPIPEIVVKNIIERCSSELITRRQRIHFSSFESKKSDFVISES